MRYSHKKVEQYTPVPLKCLKCLKYGHHRASCRGCQTCGRCGQKDPNYMEEDCSTKSNSQTSRKIILHSQDPVEYTEERGK